MENSKSPAGGAVRYDLSALEILNILGYTRPAKALWFEQLKQAFPALLKAYTEFMETTANCPLFATSNLWVGKMGAKAPVCTPRTYYRELEEEIRSLKSRRIIKNFRAHRGRRPKTLSPGPVFNLHLQKFSHFPSIIEGLFSMSGYAILVPAENRRIIGLQKGK